MLSEKNIRVCRTHLARGELQQALLLLKKEAAEGERAMVLRLLARYNTAQRDFHDGTIDYQQFEIIRNQVIKGTGDLLVRFQKNLEDQPNLSVAPSLVAEQKKEGKVKKPRFTSLQVRMLGISLAFLSLISIPFSYLTRSQNPVAFYLERVEAVALEDGLTELKLTIIKPDDEKKAYNAYAYVPDKWQNDLELHHQEEPALWIEYEDPNLILSGKGRNFYDLEGESSRDTAGMKMILDRQDRYTLSIFFSKYEKTIDKTNWWRLLNIEYDGEHKGEVCTIVAFRTEYRIKAFLGNHLFSILLLISALTALSLQAIFKSLHNENKKDNFRTFTDSVNPVPVKG